MIRFVSTLLAFVLMLCMLGCVGIRPASQSDEAHRMLRYKPNVTSNPAGLPAHETARMVAPLLETTQPGQHHQLSPGDEVMTSLRGIPNPENIRNVVDTSGNITLPLIGQVSVAGLSSSEAERMIENAYVRGGFFRSINVIVVSEDKSYFVQGEVNRQGRFRLSGEVTLLKAITEAGGYTPFANRRNVKVIRGEDVMFFNARNIANGRDPDPLIQANDIIVVLRRVL